MELMTLYAGIAERGMACIEDCGEQVDGWLRCPERDTRMGITLLIRIPTEMQGRILRMEQELLAEEPHQYYYPASDLHVTVLDLLAATPGFVYTDALVADYDRILTQAVSLCEPFSISLCGIVPSESAILVKGYYEAALTQIRQRIRKALRDERLPLEERYETISAHVTIARFAEKLQNRAELSQILSANTARDFGEFQVRDLQLVYHNWYDSQKTILAEYRLG